MFTMILLLYLQQHRDVSLESTSLRGTFQTKKACEAAAVRARGYTIGGGYGQLRDTTFRIGHMGDHTPEGLKGCLAVVGEALGEVLAG